MHKISFIVISLFLSTFSISAVSFEVNDRQLTGPTWGLVEIQSMDDRIYTPSQPNQFTLRFSKGGTVTGQVDCNRTTGYYTSEYKGHLKIGPLATTRAMCAADSIDSVYLMNIEYVRSYVFHDGDLYLSTMADGSIMKYSILAKDGESVAPSFVRE